MSKYYTPDREEFYEGFLYQYNGSKDLDLWTSMSHSYNIATLFPEGAFSGSKVRVKYLDREDIESFGFTNHRKAACAWYELEGKWDDSFCDYGYWTKLRLLHCAGENESGIKIMAYEYSFSEEETTLFQGQIKNKSELKRLLKQLKII
jgi:hypothetical protein